jgi:hypothetical protein
MENINERDHSGDLGVDVRKLYLTVIGFEGVDWIHLANNRNQWRALVSMVMNLRVP